MSNEKFLKIVEECFDKTIKAETSFEKGYATGEITGKEEFMERLKQSMFFYDRGLYGQFVDEHFCMKGLNGCNPCMICGK